MSSTTHTTHGNRASIIVAPTEPGGKYRKIPLLEGESVQRHSNQLCRVTDSTNGNRSSTAVSTYDRGNPPNLTAAGPGGETTIQQNSAETLDQIWFAKTPVPINQTDTVVCQSKDGTRQSFHCPPGSGDCLWVESPRLTFKHPDHVGENIPVEDSAMIDCKVFNSDFTELDTQELGIGEGFLFDGKALSQYPGPTVDNSATNSRTGV
jgi:hypothetical protein